MLGRGILRRLSVFAAIVMLLSGVVVRAQDTTKLLGTVADPEGKVLSGATVTITNNATSANRTVKTGDDGTYLFNQVQPGVYTVRVEAPGFKTSVRENIELLVRTPLTL